MTTKANSQKKVTFSGTVLAYTEKDSNLHLVKKYFHCKVINSLKEISLKDILCRRIVLSSPPPIHGIKSPISLIKRKLIKSLNLTIQQDLMYQNLNDIIFGEHGENVLFVSGHLAWEIYSTHCPQLSVVEICKWFSQDILREILIKTRNARNVDSSDCYTIFTNPTSSELLQAYRLSHPNRKIIVRFHDYLKNSKELKTQNLDNIISKIASLKESKIIDFVESYCQKDALSLNCLYRPNGINPSAMESLDFNFRSFLYQFSGSKSKNADTVNRIKPLGKIKEAILSFYPKAEKWLQSQTKISYQNKISYYQYIKLSAESEIYIDLVRVNQDEGFSFRIPEALSLNRKIITNRYNLKNEPFYSPDRIFLIGVDDIKNLRSFLERDLEPISPHILMLYNSSLWWTENDPYLSNIQKSVL